MTLAVIDGDLIAYKAAAACKQTTYTAVNMVDGERIIVFNKKDLADEIKKHAETKCPIDDMTMLAEWEITQDVSIQPIEYCLHSLKNMINWITKKCDTDSYVVCLSGKDNFRLDIPLPKQYKSNRSNVEKPVHLEAARNYLLDFHGAELSVGCEADDVIAEYMLKGIKENRKIVGCTIDKDAMGCTGWHLNWDKMDEPMLIRGFGELTYNSLKNKLSGYGRVWMYAQSLLGDAVDGYKPSELSGRRVGDSFVYNALKGAKNDQEALSLIKAIYQDWYPDAVTYKAWDGKEYTKNWLEIWQMYFDCARMRRWQGDVVSVEELLKNMGV